METKQTIHREILTKSIYVYNKALRCERQAYFSKIISESGSNPRILFSAIDCLLNPSQFCEQISHALQSKCEEFASFFDNKIVNIRAGIVNNVENQKNLIVSDSRGNLNSFCKISERERRKIILQLKSSTCSLDAIPTTFFKEVLDSLIGDVLDIVNCSLETGIFPDALKTALVKPLLKKHNLDSSVLSNFRPISNLPFLSKILEKAVFKQLDAFLQDNKIHEKFQSGFRRGHSTETALLKVINDLRVSAVIKMFLFLYFLI